MTPEEVAASIAAKSDQLNSEDLLGGSRTITVTKVTKGTDEQPMTIHYEGDGGKPYKPCKSMRRVLVAVWGSDPRKWKGGRLTVYRDPNVTFGGEKIGGTRISHMSGIERDFEVALTVTRGKRKAYTVKPLVDDEPAGIVMYDKEGEEHQIAEKDAVSWWRTLVENCQTVDESDALARANSLDLSDRKTGRAQLLGRHRDALAPKPKTTNDLMLELGAEGIDADMAFAAMTRREYRDVVEALIPGTQDIITIRAALAKIDDVEDPDAFIRDAQAAHKQAELI